MIVSHTIESETLVNIKGREMKRTVISFHSDNGAPDIVHKKISEVGTDYAALLADTNPFRANNPDTRTFKQIVYDDVSATASINEVEQGISLLRSRNEFGVFKVFDAGDVKHYPDQASFDRAMLKRIMQLSYREPVVIAYAAGDYWTKVQQKHSPKAQRANSLGLTQEQFDPIETELNRFVPVKTIFSQQVPYVETF